MPKISTLTFIIVIFCLLNLITWSPVKAQASPSVLLNPASQSVSPADTFTVTLDVQAITNLGGYQFNLNFDPARLTLNSAANSNLLASTGRTPIPLGTTINNAAGTLVMGVMSFGSPSGPSGNGTLVNLQFTAKDTGASSLTLSHVILSDTQGNPMENLTIQNAQVTVGAPAITPTPSPTTTAQLGLTGPIQTSINQAVDLSLNLNTPVAVTGVDAIIHYDPQKVTISSVTPTALFPNIPANTIDNQTGSLRFSAVTNHNQPFTGQGSLATIQITPLVQGAVNFTFDYNPNNLADSNVIAASNGQDILEPPSPYTIIVTDQASLQISLTTPSINTPLGHQLTGTLSLASDVNFSQTLNIDAQGYSSLINLNSSLINTLQTFYFKTSGFLKKSAALTVNSGLNLVTLGLLKAGDLNNDGIINSLDLSLMYDQWFTGGSADFNRDGTVNSADHWHLLSNFLQEDE